MDPNPTHEPEEPAASASISPAPRLPIGASTLRRDIISGYVLTISRIAAWAGVSAIVFRRQSVEVFAILALLRATITLIGYTSLGIAPAMVRMLAEAALAVPTVDGSRRSDVGANQTVSDATPVLSYAGRQAPEWSAAARVYATGTRLAALLALGAIAAAAIYAVTINQLHNVPWLLADIVGGCVLFLGLGVGARILSDPGSAVLQVRGHLTADNLITAGGEWLWLILVATAGNASLIDVTICWFFAAAIQAVVRMISAWVVSPDLNERQKAHSWPLARRLLTFGLSLTVAQVADFLYAPTDYILVNRLLTSADLATYAPLVQIDGALLLLVGGLATALFPHASLAHAAGNLRRLRRLYLRATFASALALLLAGVATWILSPTIFRLWLGEDLPAARAILPLVLIHTLVGGSSAVGRSILLGMGRVKAFTASVLVAGAANVILSAVLALQFGLKGIVLGTIIVVIGRCAIWMPWYVMRALRRTGA